MFHLPIDNRGVVWRVQKVEVAKGGLARVGGYVGAGAPPLQHPFRILPCCSHTMYGIRST